MCELIQANILPAGLCHPTASGLFTIIYLLWFLVFLLRLPWGTTKEVSDALLPGWCGTGTHWVAASVFVLCCELEYDNTMISITSTGSRSGRFLSDVVLGLTGTYQVWSTGCWRRRGSWLNWSPETSVVQRLQRLQHKVKCVSDHRVQTQQPGHNWQTRTEPGKRLNFTFWPLLKKAV